MKPPAAPQGRPLPSQEAIPPPADPAPRPQHQVAVHYHRRMHPRHVYPLRVELVCLAGPPLAYGPVSVVVRPFVPGAQVTPSEREVVSGPGGQTLFYVTPIARGRLHDARLEVRREGRLLHTIPLAMKGTTQALTWVLLALTVLIPVLVGVATKGFDLSSGNPGRYGPLERAIRANVPDIPLVTANLAALVQGVYDFAQSTDHLGFYLGVVLLGATAISWVTHRAQRALRRGPPLLLAAAVQADQDAETVHILPPGDAPTVRPAD